MLKKIKNALKVKFVNHIGSFCLINDEKLESRYKRI